MGPTVYLPLWTMCLWTLNPMGDFTVCTCVLQVFLHINEVLLAVLPWSIFI